MIEFLFSKRKVWAKWVAKNSSRTEIGSLKTAGKVTTP